MHLPIPPWFYGFDSLMYLISALIGFFISYNSYKLYSITRNKSHFYLHFGFILLSLGLFMVSLVSAFSYISFKACSTNCELGLFDLTVGIEDFGYILYFGLSIVGYSLLMLAYTFEKIKIPKYILTFVLLFSALLIIAAVPSSQLLIYDTYDQYFHLLSFLIVGYILFEILIHFSESKNITSLLVVLGFSGIFVFHILQFFAYFTYWLYVFAHISLIVGYLSLLAMLIKVKH